MPEKEIVFVRLLSAQKPEPAAMRSQGFAQTFALVDLLNIGEYLNIFYLFFFFFVQACVEAWSTQKN